MPPIVKTLSKSLQTLKSTTKKSLEKFPGFLMKGMLPLQNTPQYIKRKMNSEEKPVKSAT